MRPETWMVGESTGGWPLQCGGQGWPGCRADLRVNVWVEGHVRQREQQVCVPRAHPGGGRVRSWCAAGDLGEGAEPCHAGPGVEHGCHERSLDLSPLESRTMEDRSSERTGYMWNSKAMGPEGPRKDCDIYCAEWRMGRERLAVPRCGLCARCRWLNTTLIPFLLVACLS